MTCIAVKEDRHQNILSSVVLKKGIEEPSASERVATVINLLGCKEITLKSGTDPATIAFGNRVAENCKAEVTLEDAVKGDKPTNGMVENAVMLRGVIRTIKCHVESCTQEELREDSPILPWLVEHAGAFCPGARRVETACQEANTRVCAIRGEGVGETDILRTVEQNDSQIQVRSESGSEKQQCRVLRGDGRRCIQSA